MISYTVCPTLEQNNCFDCGVYAIAFATSLAFGEDPFCLEFDSSKIREHLGICFTQGKLELFPSKMVKSYTTNVKCSFNVKVWCHC